MHNLHLIFTLLFAMSACSSLEWAQNQILFQANDGEAFMSSGQLFGISIQAEDYFSAMKRWPSSRNESLKRRALILALHPSASQMARLDQSHSEAVELEIINSLLTHLRSTQKLSKN